MDFLWKVENKVEPCYIPGMKAIPKCDDIFWKRVGNVTISRWAEVEHFSWVYSWVKAGKWKYRKTYPFSFMTRWTAIGKWKIK